MRHHPAWRGHPAHGLLVQGRGRCTPVHVSVCLSSIYGKNARWKSARSASRLLPDSIRRCDKEKVLAVSRIRELCTANMQRTSPNPSCSLSNFIVYRDWRQRYTYITVRVIKRMLLPLAGSPALFHSNAKFLPAFRFAVYSRGRDVQLFPSWLQ